MYVNRTIIWLFGFCFVLFWVFFRVFSLITTFIVFHCVIFHATLKSNRRLCFCPQAWTVECFSFWHGQCVSISKKEKPLHLLRKTNEDSLHEVVAGFCRHLLDNTEMQYISSLDFCVVIWFKHGMENSCHNEK